MKSITKLICGTVVTILFTAANTKALTTNALWTFETSAPTTAGPVSPEVGSGTGTASTGGTYSSPSGNGSASSWSSTGWSVGDFWKLQLATTGESGITVEWDQTSSNPGPRDFDLEYSLNDSTWTLISAYSVLANVATGGRTNWQSAVYDSAYHFSFAAPAAVDNQAAVYFRLINTTTTSAAGGTVGEGGTDRIDNFLKTAVVPEPSTVMLVGAGLVGLLALRRRRS